MNKLVIILLAIVISFNISALNTVKTTKKAPYNLTVECIREPELTPVKDNKPEFAWVVPRQAIYQKAYQILVSSSALNAEKNKGDIWNSGEVKSSKSADVELTGMPLEPNTTYYWKVRIADKNSKFTKYSAVQKFTTGSFTGEITTSNVFRPEKIKPTYFRKNSDGSYFLDFGKAAF